MKVGCERLAHGSGTLVADKVVCQAHLRQRLVVVLQYHICQRTNLYTIEAEKR